ncbi:PQQ-binding-like beta-propeller repeat protein [Rhodococcus hoagii]|uniref:Secreted lipase n=1 Tax=Rhodococcus hoagii (strain 103S) TaxID=685727 RepID=A0A3S5YCW0_RHOH1|nr:PQQ-binding-like beta-propeller repeat protein [Prescottella equi]NKR88573.1 PQQ-binding-like beta-propeller repeat protein [Prescottella equi]NKS07546.1 PQQ-binding-like beta-propeller repeat protein [Prescottella equi]NKS93448.1 PQQ-binding-like beta-propeller repeat protein [Prescottella equi]NKT10819.1 PQQ-binding-like beta-propeller repeat protein [Prescottella equi]NKT16171.1 PQQ-binding-like beta-propeller repeat protein [Prescottella equi]
MKREIRNLLAAAAVAVVTVTGAVVTVAQAGDDGTRKITGTNDAAPGLGWSVDAAAMYGQAFAEFRDPRTGSEFDWGSSGFIAEDDVVVSIVGVSHGGMTLTDPQMFGIDAGNGAVRWQSAADDLGGCAEAPVDGRLVCFTAPLAEDPALVGFDLRTGEVTRTPTDWMVFAIAAHDDRLYVAEGNIEDDDVRLHAGTLADPDAQWSQPFAMGSIWEDDLTQALDVAHGQGLLTLGADVAGFDLDSGRPTWTTRLEGCSRAVPGDGGVVVRFRTECDGYRITGSDAIDSDGRTIVSTEGAGAQNLSFDHPADESLPLVVGDGAYDRRTGERVWTSPDLVAAREPDEYNSDTVRGTAVAVAGDVAILRPGAQTMSGLDLRTGERLWTHDDKRFGTVAALDGPSLLTIDGDGIRAVDTGTGESLWDTPFRKIDDDPDALASDGMLAAPHPGHYVYASSRTMIGLRPLPR